MWKDDFDKGMAAMQQADNIGNGKSELSEAEHKQRLQLYKSAADAFVNAKKISRRMSATSVYFIATSLYKQSLEESALGKDVDAYKTIRQAIENWPDLDVVPASKFTEEQRVRVDGRKQTFEALGDVEDWKHSYFKSYIRAMQLANILRRYDEAIDYGNFILDEADTLNNENFIAWSELSKTYKNQNDNCKSAEFAMKALDGALLYDIEKPEDKEVLHDYLPEMAVNVSPTKDCRFNAVKWEERAALALARLHEIDDQSFYVLLYGKDAYNKGRKSAELLVALAEAEFYQSQQKDVIANDNDKTNWFAEVEARKKEFNSDELKRVANLYKIQGNTELENTTLRKAKTRYFWENTHIGISTNPVNFYWGQYLGAVHFMFPKKSHEFRVNYNTSSTHLFWKRSDDKTPGAVFFIFSGYELSYTLKFMEKDIKGVKGKRFYSGPQFRVENREYVPANVRVAKDMDFSNPYTKKIEARSDRYEALLMVGTQRRSSRWFFIDYFFGVGVGYKTFITQNLEANEQPLDDRFNKGLWNKAYVPVHAGVRVGVILK
jgi:hypothetical protein